MMPELCRKSWSELIHPFRNARHRSFVVQPGQLNRVAQKVVGTKESTISALFVISPFKSQFHGLWSINPHNSQSVVSTVLKRVHLPIHLLEKLQSNHLHNRKRGVGSQVRR